MTSAPEEAIPILAEALQEKFEAGRQSGLEEAARRVEGMQLRADSDFLQQVAAAIREIKLTDSEKGGAH